MKIAIYGDSFGNSMINDTVERIDRNTRGKAWVELLADDYDVTNFAHTGSSLFYSYKLFLENNQKFDYNIFLVTESNRITLPDEFDIPPLTKHINLSFVDSLKHTYSSNATSDSRLTYIISALESYYAIVHNDHAVDIFHNLMLENINRINQNTIIIPCFNDSIPNTEVSLNSISGYEFYDSKVMYYLKEKNYCNFTPIEDENGKWTYNDYRKCHLNEENNKILFNLINDAIINKQQTININLKQFVKASKDIEYYYYLIRLSDGHQTGLNGELHNLYSKLLIDTN